jgi:hypothetical protein
MNKLVRVGMDALDKIHWDGTGCTTNDNSACVYCFGPSPMSSFEVAEAVIDAVEPIIREDQRKKPCMDARILRGLRAKVVALDHAWDCDADKPAGARMPCTCPIKDVIALFEGGSDA